MRVASFFAGIGGFDLGLERAGMQVVFQSEINNFCRAVLRKHWPSVKLEGDIAELEGRDIPDADLWCGGFPCQDVSLANQGKRKGLNGKRSGLFFEFARLIKEKTPNWIVLENVPGLLNSNSGEDFKVILQTMDELGYCVAWRVLDAKFYGTPQRRRRVFIVGSYRSIGSFEVLFNFARTELFSGTRKGKGDFTSERLGTGNKNTALYSIQHATIRRKHSAGPQAKGYRNDRETYTLDSRGTSNIVCQANDPFGVRTASGFSRGLDYSRFKAIGNAVSVPIIEWIGKRILLSEEAQAVRKSSSSVSPTSVQELVFPNEGLLQWT